MIIKELNLISFGKFQKKLISLDSGLNLIYGSNESGKSTVHKFIEGMFFGFFRDYNKRKLYSEDYQKYYPWNRNEYLGILKYTYGGKVYRIERNFVKGKDNVVVYDDITGEDISDNFPYDKATKLYQPSKHLTLNRVVYNNTVNIKQLGNQTDENLAREVKDSLVNLGGTKDEDISVKNVINYLQENKDQIGKKTRKNTPYGKTASKIEELENEKNRIIIEHKEGKFKLQQINKIKKEIELIEEKNKYLEDQKKAYNFNKIKDKLRKFEHLMKENITISNELKEISSYKDISEEEYDNVLIFNQKINSINKSLSEFSNNKLEINNVINEIELELESITDEKINIDSFDEDYYQFDRYNREKEKLSVNFLNKQMAIIKNRYNQEEKTLELLKIWKIVLFMISAISVVIGFVIKPIIILASIIPIIGFVGLIITGKSKKKCFLEIRKEYENSKSEIKDTLRVNEDLKCKINNILVKYHCNTEDEFISFRRKYSTVISKTIEMKNNLKYYYERKKEISQKILILENDNKEIINDLHMIYQKYDLNNIDQYKKAVNYKRRYNELKERKENNDYLAKELLEGSTIDTLKKKYSDYMIEETAITSISMENIEYNLKQNHSDLMERKEKVSKLEGEIENSIGQLRLISEVEEEIEYNYKKINDYDFELQAINIALESIESISKEIHSDFAPKLNKKIGEIIYNITNKYQEIKVTSNLDIKVNDPQDNIFVNIQKLSGGTIDQLYFATRLGIIDIIKGENNIPVILDDCFIQYDEDRLKNILNYIKKQSNQRQILLFTCQTREQEILDKINAEYQFIKL